MACVLWSLERERKRDRERVKERVSEKERERERERNSEREREREQQKKIHIPVTLSNHFKLQLDYTNTLKHLYRLNTVLDRDTMIKV